MIQGGNRMKTHFTKAAAEIIAYCILALCMPVMAGDISDNVVGIYNLTIQPGQSYVAFPYQKSPWHPERSQPTPKTPSPP